MSARNKKTNFVQTITASLLIAGMVLVALGIILVYAYQGVAASISSAVWGANIVTGKFQELIFYPQSLIGLGIILVLMIQIVRMIALLVQALVERNHVYVWITSILLTVMVLGAWLGKQTSNQSGSLELPLQLAAFIFATAFIPGFVGSLVGVGGGIILVPTLNTLFNIPLPQSSAVGILAVVGTASAANQENAHSRLGRVMGVATAIGAYVGVALASSLPTRIILMNLGITLLVVVPFLIFKKKQSAASANRRGWLIIRKYKRIDRLCIRITRLDESSGQHEVQRLLLPFVMMFVAGMLSGMLGIGGGPINVTVMELVAGLPIKASAATSSFLLGIAGFTGASIAFQQGISLLLGGVVLLGIVTGARLGALAQKRAPAKIIKWVFIVVLVATALQVLWKSFH